MLVVGSDDGPCDVGTGQTVDETTARRILEPGQVVWPRQFE